MAILHFPLGSHLGRLIWDKEEDKLSSEAIENATWALYYMGYNASENVGCSEIHFSMRELSENNKSDYRNMLFDFALVFSMFNINLPDLDYSKTFLGEFYIPLEDKNVVLKSKLIVHNETLYLEQIGNYMVNGSGYNIPNLEMYIDRYNEGEEILPLISEDKLYDILLKIKMDALEGTSLNDPFTDSL